MITFLFYLIGLQTIYYTVKCAVKRAYTDFFNGLSIDITYNKRKVQDKPNLDYYDERNENLDELD